MMREQTQVNVPQYQMADLQHNNINSDEPENLSYLTEILKRSFAKLRKALAIATQKDLPPQLRSATQDFLSQTEINEEIINRIDIEALKSQERANITLNERNIALQERNVALALVEHFKQNADNQKGNLGRNIIKFFRKVLRLQKNGQNEHNQQNISENPSTNKQGEGDNDNKLSLIGQQNEKRQNSWSCNKKLCIAIIIFFMAVIISLIPSIYQLTKNEQNLQIQTIIQIVLTIFTVIVIGLIIKCCKSKARKKNESQIQMNK